MLKGKKSTLCWTCQNGYANKCPWMTDFTPVEGWEAEKTVIMDNIREPIDSYLVIKCPMYVKENIKDNNSNFCNYKNIQSIIKNKKLNKKLSEKDRYFLNELYLIGLKRFENEFKTSRYFIGLKITKIKEKLGIV